MNILLIDDDVNLRRSLRLALGTMNHQVTEARDSTQALDLLAHGLFEVAFLDLRLGREDGLTLLPELLRLAPGLDVIVMTAYATMETAIEALRRGAFDYLPKPFTPDHLRLVLNRIAQKRKLFGSSASGEDQVRAVVPEVDLQTDEPVMQQALEVCFKAAASDVSLLLRGESGTGKGILARAIHARSPRAAAPFVTIHCPSLPAELLESELFGHVRGSFTGAVRDTVGKVTSAEGGTLFLDEVGDLPSALQPKLLRLLQEKRYERVGEPRTRVADVRIIAATNVDLVAAVAAGRFREDLLFRLNVIEIVLPPLRNRPRDLPRLANHLLTYFAREMGKPITGFSAAARAALEHYHWPGNLRELRNVVERCVLLSSGPEVEVAALPPQVVTPPAPRVVEVGGAGTLEQLEAEHIRRVLAAAPTLEDAAARLGIDPSTLYRKRKRYGL